MVERSVFLYLFINLLFFRYHPPTGTDVEKVVIREMRNANDPVKKVILSMSDLHLDCDWSKGMHDRLYQFITKLASVAEVKYVNLI